jgi:hypothetical protein
MKNNEVKSISTAEKSVLVHESKKHHPFKSPDVNQMQSIEIDRRTRIYIAIGADPIEARNRYLNRLDPKVREHYVPRKTVVV